MKKYKKDIQPKSERGISVFWPHFNKLRVTEEKERLMRENERSKKVLKNKDKNSVMIIDGLEQARTTKTKKYG